METEHELFRTYLSKIGIQIKPDIMWGWWWLKDKNRTVIVKDYSLLLFTGIRMQRLRILEDSVLWEKDPHKRRKIQQTVYKQKQELAGIVQR